MERAAVGVVEGEERGRKGGKGTELYVISVMSVIDSSPPLFPLKCWFSASPRKGISLYLWSAAVMLAL